MVPRPTSFVVLVLAASLIGTHLSALEEEASPKRDQDEYYELLKLFVETFNEVERNYVSQISRRELMEAAIEGMLSELDQHSDYIAPADLEDFRRGVESEFGGIGVQVAIEDDELTVISPIVGSPAYQAGLVAGDVVTKIKGEPTKGMTLGDAVKLIKGKLGTKVEITVRHAGNETEDTIEVERASVRLRTVRGERRKTDDSWDFIYDSERKVAYIRITSFARHTVRELRAALEELVSQEVKGLILDLRSNPGGLLSAAIEVSDMFVSEGIIVSTTGRNVEERKWTAHKAGTYSDFPVAVLVNRFSASASEIVAGCLQDHERAVVIGQRTWGKGSVQNILQLESGRSALKLTTAEYRRPNGKNIHRADDASEEDEWGITPNEGLELKLSDVEAARLERVRRTRDLLRESPEEDRDVEDKQLALAVKYMLKEVASVAADE
ncbi:MAG: peptidase S41 [Planctomycetaceae bacterium]|nr:peptidase S41 [Planctomycetaceae bacterium]